MNTKNPGFIRLPSNSAAPLDVDMNNASPLTVALQQRRQKAASKRSQIDPNADLDSLGNPQPAENPDD